MPIKSVPEKLILSKFAGEVEAPAGAIFGLKKIKKFFDYLSCLTCFQAANLLARGELVINIAQMFCLGKVRSRGIFWEGVE